MLRKNALCVDCINQLEAYTLHDFKLTCTVDSEIKEGEKEGENGGAM